MRSLQRVSLVALRRQVNEARATLGRAIVPDATSDWLFVCECGRPECAEQVEVGFDVFGAMSASGLGHVLAPGHEVARARAARAQARELQREAAALRAQAEQIGRRFDLGV